MLQAPATRLTGIDSNRQERKQVRRMTNFLAGISILNI